MSAIGVAIGAMVAMGSGIVITGILLMISALVLLVYPLQRLEKESLEMITDYTATSGSLKVKD